MLNIRKALGINRASTVPAASPETQLVPVPVHRPRSDAVLDPPQVQAGYLQRGAAQDIHWGAPLRLADHDVRSAWAPAAGSVRHLVQNSGWLSGAVDQLVAYSVGTGLRPEITPDGDALGWEPAFTKTWARRIEKAFLDWANNPIEADDQQRLTFGAAQAAALRGWFSTGDVIAVMTYRTRVNARYKTGIAVLDPVRVATPPIYQIPGRVTAFEGIEVDKSGVPVAYWLKPLPGDHKNPQGIRIPVWAPNGRQGIVHSFIGEPGQLRGISPFAPVIDALRQTVSVSDSMVLAAAAAAAIIGTITSDLPSADVARTLGHDGNDPIAAIMAARGVWHQGLAKVGADVKIGSHARVHHLSSGEKFELHAGRTHYEHFPEHLKALLREIARASGLPYESFSLDRSAATYSSGRLGIVDMWALIELRRASLIEPMCKVALANFVEELIDKKEVPYPGGLDAFRKQKTLALKATWRGPAKPSADELKAVRASAERLRIGISSLSREAAEQGADWEETLLQRASEQELARELGLEVPQPTTTRRLSQQEGKP